MHGLIIHTLVPPKREALLAAEAITGVSAKTCCQNNCLQSFPHGQIQVIQAQLHINDEEYARKKCLLEVHRQIYKDLVGKEWLTLKGVEVYPTA